MLASPFPCHRIHEARYERPLRKRPPSRRRGGACATTRFFLFPDGKTVRGSRSRWIPRSQAQATASAFRCSGNPQDLRTFYPSSSCNGSSSLDTFCSFFCPLCPGFHSFATVFQLHICIIQSDISFVKGITKFFAMRSNLLGLCAALDSPAKFLYTGSVERRRKGRNR